MIYVILLQTLFALGFVVTKATLVYASPIFLMGVRFVCGGLVLLGYYALTDGRRWRLTPSLVCALAGSTLFHIYATNVLEAWGLQYIIAAQASLIYSFSPFVSALLGYLWFQENINARKLAGLALGFAGLALVFVPTLSTSSTVWLATGGEIALVGAAIATAIGWLSVKRALGYGLPIAYINGVSMLVGGLGALVTACCVEDTFVTPHALASWHFYVLCALGITIYCFICYNLYAYLLRRYSATFLCFSSFLAPLVTALFGWFFLGEHVTYTFFASIALVFCGVYLFHQQEHSQETL